MTRYRKLIAAAIGATGEAVALGLVPGVVSKWLAVVIAFATAAGVYAVPNEPPVPPQPAPPPT